MATKKAGGSTQNGRDSWSKRRGVKRHDGEIVNAGEVLIRQKGYWYRPGDNVYVAKDWTLHAEVPGKVFFLKKRIEKFNGKREMATIIGVKAAA
ncbi:MAG: 50S ribosomal protein L27 [Candidatus Peribacteraceae bacterium]|nr:50S ribosomal protein L27 [Candidatus Peribacteraceae bacterium]